MPGDQPFTKRKNYFIKKDFQTRFILKFCLLLLLGVIISTGLLFIFSQDTLTSSFEDSRLQIKSTGLAILPSVILTNLMTLALIALASVGITLFVSHRIAGPLFRFEKDLKDIGKGDLTKRVSLRRKDQMMAIAKAMNEMAGGLQKKVQFIQQDVEQIKQKASHSKDAKDLLPDLEILTEKIHTSFNL
jgi:methyl-accepting chemotaxis protein